jgi:hypothetical protein
MSVMALRNVLILRKPRSGCLEGRSALIRQRTPTLNAPFRGNEEAQATASEIAEQHQPIRQ